MSLPVTANAMVYMVHSDDNGPFAYATLADFGPGQGLLQIHSDWGTYSYYWGSMGERSLREFLLDTSPSYVEGKLSSNMHSMGMKKQSFIRLARFMSQCWPRLIELFNEAKP